MRRRHLLQLLGLGGLAGMGAGLAGLGRGRVWAQGADGPVRRLLVISHCHGWPYDAWKMRPDGASDDADWTADLTSLAVEDFSHALAPLHAHRSRLLAIDGISLTSAELDVDGNRHDTGWVHAWTGDNADFSGSETRATAASIDQRVAAHIARPDRLPSLEISIDDASEPARPIAYGPSGAPLPSERTPERVWQRLFGPSTSPSALAERQRAALDFAHAEAEALSPSLDAAQRARLDQHYDRVQALGARLEGMAELSCNAIPELSGTLASYDQRFDAVSEIIGAAFACDVTRVVSLSLGEMPTADFGADDITDDVHKGLAHEIYNDPDKHQAMADYVAKHAEQVARLVTALESLPDLDGGSVMDNTLIVWGSELANGWHGYQHYCPVLIGGSWHFYTGRYVHWPHSSPAQLLIPSGYSTAAGRPHQQLLVSVAQAMGMDIDHVGREHMQGQAGDYIDCRGPLPNLT